MANNILPIILMMRRNKEHVKPKMVEVCIELPVHKKARKEMDARLDAISAIQAEQRVSRWQAEYIYGSTVNKSQDRH